MVDGRAPWACACTFCLAFRVDIMHAEVGVILAYDTFFFGRFGGTVGNSMFLLVLNFLWTKFYKPYCSEFLISFYL